MNSLSTRTRAVKGFTLIEMLVVVAILGLLLAMTGLGSAGSQTAQKLKSESLNLAGEVHNALLESVKNNGPVALRFYEHIDSSQPESVAKWRSWQVIRRMPDGELKPLAEMHRMESGVVIEENETYSTVFSTSALSQRIQTPDATKDPFLGAGVGHNYRYLEIEFRPNGSNSLKWDAQNRTWSVVFVAEHGATASTAGVPADNYRAVLIDPFNSRTMTY